MFINIPNNYSSMWGELIFEYNSTSDSDLLIEMQDEDLGETIAVKKFYSTSSLKLNVTPLLFESMLPQAQYSSTGLTTFERGFPKISLIVGSQSTDARRFTYAKDLVEPPILLTTMPTDRLLWAHESDNLTILVGEGSEVEVTIEGGTSSGTMSTISTLSDSDGGAKCLTINADDFVDSYDTLRVTLSCDGEQFEQINYTLSADEATGYRTAWISSQGSIEHYTFPVVEEQQQLSSGATLYSLRSAYGTAQESEAVAEMISSPKVWRADNASYSSIEMLSDSLTLRSAGALMIANFKISENG